jgi:archaellum component FlaF (FlaF/FlaG flagellin family)
MLGILCRSLLHTVFLAFCTVVYFIQLRYRMPRILYAIHYGRECQAYCMQYTTVQNAKHIKQYTTVQSAKHTVCNTLRYRVPSILYEIHYGTEFQAYCMKYTTVQNAKNTVCNKLRHRIASILFVVYCIRYSWHSVP